MSIQFKVFWFVEEGRQKRIHDDEGDDNPTSVSLVFFSGRGMNRASKNRSKMYFWCSSIYQILFSKKGGLMNIFRETLSRTCMREGASTGFQKLCVSEKKIVGCCVAPTYLVQRSGHNDEQHLTNPSPLQAPKSRASETLIHYRRYL